MLGVHALYAAGLRRAPAACEVVAALDRLARALRAPAGCAVAEAMAMVDWRTDAMLSMSAPARCGRALLESVMKNE